MRDRVMVFEGNGWVAGTGRGVRIAVIDSGVYAAHPHVQGVSGGIAIGPDGPQGYDYVDRLGHGTAVTAAIREKAPNAEILAVRIFDRALSTDIRTLVHALAWVVSQDVHLINLSLGTSRPEHERVLVDAVSRAAVAGTVIVAAGASNGIRWLPGSLAGVVPVHVDWACPRDRYRIGSDREGRVIIRASGFPRSIPGVPPARNLQGVSFAVANVTGFAARALEGVRNASFDGLLTRLSACFAAP